MKFKQAFMLIMLVALGWGTAKVLQNSVSLGKDLGRNQIARDVQEDRNAPELNAPELDVTSSTLTLVVFTDYQCTACRSSNPGMERAVAKDGHVRISYRDWPVFGPLSVRAAQIALASDKQAIYPRLHSELMTTSMPLSDDRIKQAVQRAGGNWSILVSDLERHAHEINTTISQNQTDAFALGLSGTPSYLAGTILVEGALSEAEFLRLFTRARAAKE